MVKIKNEAQLFMTLCIMRALNPSNSSEGAEEVLLGSVKGKSDRSGGVAPPFNIATKESPFSNTLGMNFVPVPETEVLFSVWDTRVKDFATFVEASGYNGSTSWKTPKFSQTGDHPVVNVNWDEAKAFCKWLTKKERSEGKIGGDQEYRLPTDEEWSVAVGLPPEIGNTPKEKDGKVKDVYPWGTQWPPPKGSGNYDPDYAADSYDNTSPVGSFSANQFGLFDLGGNVWQWCEDWYSDDKESPAAFCVARGGMWYMPGSGWLLSSRRHKCFPDSRHDSTGFRCVLVGGNSKPMPMADSSGIHTESNGHYFDYPTLGESFSSVQQRYHKYLSDWKLPKPVNPIYSYLFIDKQTATMLVFFRNNIAEMLVVSPLNKSMNTRDIALDMAQAFKSRYHFSKDGVNRWVDEPAGVGMFYNEEEVYLATDFAFRNSP